MKLRTYVTPQMAIGAILRFQRQMVGQGIAALAERLNRHESMVSRYECGLADATTGFLLEWCAALDLRVDSVWSCARELLLQLRQVDGVELLDETPRPDADSRWQRVGDSLLASMAAKASCMPTPGGWLQSIGGDLSTFFVAP